MITGEVSNASLLAIANSSGFLNMVSLRRVNGEEAHARLIPFSGDYVRLFDSMHGILSMSTLLSSNPELHIPHSL